MVLYSNGTGTPDERPDVTVAVPETSLNFSNDEPVLLRPKGTGSVVPSQSNGLQDFIYLGTHHVRVVIIDGQPWFVAADVCGVLGYANGSRDVERHVRPGQRQKYRIGTPGDVVPFREMWIITEGGLYRLIMGSEMPTAEAFQDWVTDEVLPTIRKTGSYSVQFAVPQSFAEALELAARQAREIESRDSKIAALEPVAKSWTELADAGGDYSVREAAQVLDRDPNISTGQKRLFAYLRDIHWIDRNNEPMQEQINNGRIARRVTGGWTDPNGAHHATSQARVTPKGMHELHKRLGGSGPLLLAM